MQRQEKFPLRALACAAASLFAPYVFAADDGAAAPVRQLGLVTIEGNGAPSSLPTNLPTTIEGISGAEIERSINANDAEDALKYLPSLLVRKRYDGDYNHAVLSTRASGTGNSARSLVFADGILLSNLLGNGATFAPRWGLVTPEEIERVDVLYGPFSAAYAGNSVGAVVDYQTRMPRAFEAHVKASIERQPFDLYGAHDTYGSHSLSASLGDRAGALSWWINVNRLDSDGQPLSFVTKPVSTTAYTGSTPVTGAVDGADKSNVPWKILGTTTQYDTVQDHAKIKLAYDIAPALRASLTLGLWRNDSAGSPQSWLRDAAGNAVYSGSVGIAGKAYTLAATDFGISREALEHRMAGISLKQNAHGVFDWELTASAYDYAKDQARTALVAPPVATTTGGAGRLTDLAGTGWTTLAARGVLRPEGSAHTLDFGAQLDRYRYRQRVSNTADWDDGTPTSLFTAFGGDTALTSLYAQDSWSLPASGIKTMLGLRAEHWQADSGSKTASDGRTVGFASRSETDLSPKAAIGWQAGQDLALKLSTGRAVRYPTATELYQGGLSSSGAYVPGDPVTNPDLRPEKGWTTELAALWNMSGQQLRLSLFREDTRDALYSQSTVVGTQTVASVQNIGRIVTNGVEAVLQASDLGARGFDLSASLTYADSTIRSNDGFVAVPGDTIGKQQPRVPRWRASLLASYAITPDLDASFGARYSGRQYGTLNNSDPNGFAYMGFSKFFTTDVRVHWRIDRQWSLAAGIDNLNNYRYWAFHPYPQRSYNAELRFDL
ncbi:TonB-dependent receptor [Paucibacter sp. R3-3]|uniref:TonB-dependent receptor n=1 Tax=Roseateles agri TaxID=3098619 RepID=A0ABU5DAY6_9BURK|nr:TonB-dependent receptor [Paucibacter sp. R3-3]MDY0742965.1 TonB-dependent receptor [Paucibacter sp. R3-3]